MDYTRLNDVCLAGGLTRDALLRKGAEGELSIFVVPHPSWVFQSQYVRAIKQGEDVTDYLCMAVDASGPFTTLLLLRVAPFYLQNYLNYPETATIEWFMPDGIPESDVSTLMYKGEMPLLMNDCCLVIKNEDLVALSGKKRRAPTARKVEAEVESWLDDQVAAPVSENNKRPTVTVSLGAELLDVKEVASLIGVSKNTVLNYVRDGKFPNSIKLPGRAIRWRTKEVLEWITGQPTTER